MRTTDKRNLLIIGSGITGAYAAALAIQAGHHVQLVTKGVLGYSNSAFAQGGITAVTPDSVRHGDSVASHIQDTLVAGAHRNDRRAVAHLCTEAAAHITALSKLGVEFDRETTPAGTSFQLGLEGAHSYPRILHVNQDATGAGIMDALTHHLKTAEEQGRAKIYEHTAVSELVTENGAMRGVLARGTHPGAETIRLDADAVLIATGGLGDLYKHSTNPSGASGDGVWLAWHVGAALKDLEFIQFHPTLVEGTSFMVSEALRGEGAILRDYRGERFMPSIHPSAELASRDIVSRAIYERKKATGHSVFLDARALEKERGQGFLAARFPMISAKLAEHGYNLAQDLIPVTPAQHYWMGGIATDLDAKTTVPGLYAAGESACTGVHGANRLASNSLLEGVVFAAAAIKAISSETWNQPAALPEGTISEGLLLPHTHIQDTIGVDDDPVLAKIQEVADNNLGVVRSGKGLAEAESSLALLASAHEHHLAALGALIAYAANLRTESIGAHTRSDYPHTETDHRTTHVLQNARSYTRPPLSTPANP